MINLSPAAAQEVERIQSNQQKPTSYLRLGVEAGGCYGLFYTIELSETVGNADCISESNGISILIDEHSLPHLEGLKLDYSEDLMGGSFRFHNSKVVVTCSCGLSFSCEPQRESLECC